MTLIPTDRQQTYRILEFGKSLKNGYFVNNDEELFSDQGIPSDPNDAQFWINLEHFKTAATYGEFWYPVPNVQFSDSTTFYEFICAWLWGFWDERKNWTPYYKAENKHWQGFIDEEGKRKGWRAALKPNHSYIFTMPNAGTAFYTNVFTALIREIFVHFTQEEGPPVPVTPHSFRHMLATYLAQLGMGGEEVKSFAYVLHHSPEIHQGCYVYRDNMQRIAPAVQRMEEIIKRFI